MLAFRIDQGIQRFSSLKGGLFFWVVLLGCSPQSGSESSSVPESVFSPVPANGSSEVPSPASTPTQRTESFREKTLRLLTLENDAESDPDVAAKWLDRMTRCLESKDRSFGDEVFCVTVLGNPSVKMVSATDRTKVKLNQLLIRTARYRLSPRNHPIPILFASAVTQTLTAARSASYLAEREKRELAKLLSSALTEDIAQDSDQAFFPAQRREIEEFVRKSLGQANGGGV